MIGRHTPPTMVPTSDLDPPELLPEGAVASGSLPAAFASVTSIDPVYTYSIRDMDGLLVEYTYGPIRIRPMWDCSFGGDIEGVPVCGDKPLNWNKKAGP